MKPLWTFMILITYPVIVFGQDNAQGVPKVARAVGWEALGNLQPSNVVPPGAGWAYGSPQTAEGAALQGMSQVVSAAGQYNRATAASALNLTEAQSNAMRNRVQAVQTFYEMRAAGRAGRELERGPQATPEELARRARAAAPRALNSSQVDPVSGVLFWPAALQDASFESSRAALDEFAMRWMKYGGLDYSEQAQVREKVSAMLTLLKSQISTIPPQNYVECRSFLQSLLFATTKSFL